MSSDPGVLGVKFAASNSLLILSAGVIPGVDGAVGGARVLLLFSPGAFIFAMTPLRSCICSWRECCSTSASFSCCFSCSFRFSDASVSLRAAATICGYVSWHARRHGVWSVGCGLWAVGCGLQVVPCF